MKYHSENYDEICLLSPYSKVYNFILYLYSMELGSPPIYAEINRVTRSGDMKYLKTLGPFIKCLSQIAMVGDDNKLK